MALGVLDIVKDIGHFAKGLETTLKHAFRKPVTYQYPEQRRPVHPRFRARHKLLRYENGLERCVGCSLCAGVCPAKAIYVEAEENTDDNRVSAGERYAKRYEINMIRCIYCGLCEQACPTEAIVLGNDYELSSYDRTDFIFEKQHLLVPEPMRAKAPEGDLLVPEAATPFPQGDLLHPEVAAAPTGAPEPVAKGAR